MRTLAMDLGTKTLGLAITDKTNTLSSPLKTLHYDDNNYDQLFQEIKAIIANYQIDNFVLGLPKNMDNSLGFASNRSLEFKKIFDEYFHTSVILIDERLSTVEAENILITNDMRRNKRKKVIDSVAAMIILDTYLRKEKQNG